MNRSQRILLVILIVTQLRNYGIWISEMDSRLSSVQFCWVKPLDVTQLEDVICTITALRDGMTSSFNVIFLLLCMQCVKFAILVNSDFKN